MEDPEETGNPFTCTTKDCEQKILLYSTSTTIEAAKIRPLNQINNPRTIKFPASNISPTLKTQLSIEAEKIKPLN